MALTKVRVAGLGLADDTTTITLEDTSSHSANTGPAISFKSKDSGGTTREVAKIVGESHSGANEGNLALQTRNGGTLETKWKLFKNGNFIPTNSAYGIVLGNTTSTDANLLDDYEEGTWSPTMEHQGNSNLSTTKTSNNVASYVKIGTTVQFQMILSISAVSGGDGSNLQVGNMPFTAKSISTHGYGGATVTYTAWNTTNPIAATVLSSSDNMRLYTAALQPALGNQLQANSYIVLHGQYETAS